MKDLILRADFILFFTFMILNLFLLNSFNRQKYYITKNPNMIYPQIMHQRSTYKMFSQAYFSTTMNVIMEKSNICIPSGLCAVYKPKGCSSSDVVTKIKYILQDELRKRTGNKKLKIKIGHGGTLDPLAEGVLVLGIGSGNQTRTKLLSNYLAGSKGYQAVAKLGISTDTYDNTGNITETKDCSHINKLDIINTLTNFRGDIQQLPPMFSALKKNGMRLYELARQGIEVERKLRNVTVYKLELLDNNNVGESIYQLPEYVLDIECSGGFYVRSLIVDIASSINTLSHMTALMRTKQGEFLINDCLKPDDWNYNNIITHTIKTTKKINISIDKIPDHCFDIINK